MRQVNRIWNRFSRRGLAALAVMLGLLLVPGGAASQDAPSAPVFDDDMESGPGNWVVDTPIPLGAPWAIVETQSHSPTHSWFTDDPANISDKRVAFAADIEVPGGAELSFWLRWVTENTFDGSVLEYSLDGGTTWTDILAAQGPVPADPARITQTPYNVTISSSFGSPISGRLAWSGNFPSFNEVKVDLAAFSGLNARFRWRFASDNSVSSTGVWLDDVVIVAFIEGTGLSVDAGGNGVFQPGEDAAIEPTWQNNTVAAITVTGAMSNFTGPAGPTYTVVDGTADYGTIPAGGSGTCTDCYALSIDAPVRPATHIDATVDETLSPGAIPKTWTLHIGDSFTDVSPTSPFLRFVETLLHAGVTSGCGADTYCPTAATTREQMAPFVLVAKEGTGYTPPDCVPPNYFTDVPETSPFCRYIENLAERLVVSGCGVNLYCPSDPVTREQMAIFVLRTLDPALDPPACGTPMFNDVPASSPFCRWVEELARRGVVSGCGGGNYCPGDPVTREQMGVFLSVTFGLLLYGA
jgi:hypothetical protein